MRKIMLAVMLAFLLGLSSAANAARLPVENGDYQIWDTLLNQFLIGILGPNGTYLNVTQGANITPYLNLTGDMILSGLSSCDNGLVTTANGTVICGTNASGGGGGGGMEGAAPYLYNDTTKIYWNETTGNRTYYTQKFANSTFLMLSGGTIAGKLNATAINATNGTFYLVNSTIVNTTNLSVLDTFNFGSPSNHQQLAYLMNGTLRILGPPGGANSYLRASAAIMGSSVLSWVSPLPIPSFNDILSQNRSTGDQNILVSPTQQISFFDDNNYIMAASSNLINITTPTGGMVWMNTNLTHKRGTEMQVIPNEKAFSALGFPKAALYFIGGANARYEFDSTTGVEHMNITALTTGGGNLWVRDSITTSNTGKITVGNASSAGQLPSSIKASVVYYQQLVSYSPHMFSEDSEVGYTRMCWKDKTGYWDMLWMDKGVLWIEKNNTYCWGKNQKFVIENQTYSAYESDKAACEKSNKDTNWPEWEFVGYEEYKKGDTTCSLIQIHADQNCKEKYNATYVYDKDKEECKMDPVLDCLYYPWKFWNTKDTKCFSNPKYECMLAPYYANYTWNPGKMKCDFDPQKECKNRGAGWYWMDGECQFSYEKENSDNQEECENRGIEWIWDGVNQECVEAKNYDGG